ncbi:MAG: ABC transporter permease [Phycisphaerales bacterium]|nr:ABC transporter permease [Phycisphaerales bacterium]
MPTPLDATPSNIVTRVLARIGQRAYCLLDAIGGIVFLLVDTLRWIMRSLCTRQVRIGRAAVVSQLVRVGVRSIGIVCLVSGAIGFILGLQMAPPLDNLGQVELVPNIIGVAIMREMGPIIAAIVLTGFAGAAIAAELGTMVVGEEIEALEAHALNPIRFLVVPRVIACVCSLFLLTVLADLCAVGAGFVMGVMVLDLPASTYIDNTLRQVDNMDYITGLIKALVFGLEISLIACYNGLRVTGGAEGVGRATTSTVVQSIVAIILADLVFTAAFYALGWG